MTNPTAKGRFKHPWRWVSGLTVLVLVGAGIWFYKFYFVSTDLAIRHAEAFLFRRMTVAQLAEQGEYRFFYATNRQSTADDAPPGRRFGSERGEQLNFGSFDAQIQPTLGLGLLTNPTEWFQNEEIRVRDVQSLTQSEFVEKLRALVQKSPHRGLLLVVHGFRSSFQSALGKTAFLGHVLDINSPVLMFDWPGNQGSSLSGYRRARQVAEASGAELARTLELIVREIRPEKLWLLANSMGAQVVADAFDLLYQNADFADAEIELEDVVLTAPDVGHDEFNQAFKDRIAAMTRNLTVYVSSNDRALLFSRLINRGQRLGESTLGPDQLQQAAKVAELTDPNSDLVTLIDVTPVNRTRNFHNFSLETPEFFDDLFLRLINTETPRSRLLYQVQTPEGATYSVLTRGR